MSKTYDDFFEALGQKESGGRYDVINKTTQFLGKYQMGEQALMDTKYYGDDKHNYDNQFCDKFWTGKDGVKSKQGFLNNHQAQENVVRAFAEKNWSYIQAANLDMYVGQTVHGYYLTISGMLAGAHLLGVTGKHGLKDFINNGVIGRDGNKTPIVEYIKKFAGYETPFSPRKKLTGIKRNKHGKTVMYQIDQKEWVAKEVALAMVENKELDGVIVTNKKGAVFLKNRPDQRIDNNLV